MSAITTHVLDTARGRPAAGVRVALERLDAQEQWKPIAEGVTDADGRLRTLMPEGTAAVPGAYRLVFDTRRYFDALLATAFYPQVIVTFTVTAEEHYHVPLLLSPFGYSTYRGT
ncbi:MAG TPA: hydroxyisourate hydrolase [Vicinamibacterales bacterium]|nr:hydroxyisourate hydrolase [Vicinamibacterales bacterium]